MSTRPVVTFLSDFGLEDAFAGICHGVIARACPDAQVVHVTHGIEPQAVARGARVLAAAIPYLPRGIHLAVVDPGVGSERRAVVVESADGRLFVGPDNGVLMAAVERCGGAVAAYRIENETLMLQPVSRTFHGRDLFAPVAGHLAGGGAPADVGPPVPTETLVRVPRQVHTFRGDVLEAAVEGIDRFGNVELSVAAGDLRDRLRPGGVVEIDTGDDRYYARCAATFADVGEGEFVVYEDSHGALSIAINHGSAAELMAAAEGRRVRIDFEPGEAAELWGRLDGGPREC